MSTRTSGLWPELAGILGLLLRSGLGYLTRGFSHTAAVNSGLIFSENCFQILLNLVSWTIKTNTHKDIVKWWFVKKKRRRRKCWVKLAETSKITCGKSFLSAFTLSGCWVEQSPSPSLSDNGMYIFKASIFTKHCLRYHHHQGKEHKKIKRKTPTATPKGKKRSRL